MITYIIVKPMDVPAGRLTSQVRDDPVNAVPRTSIEAAFDTPPGKTSRM